MKILAPAIGRWFSNSSRRHSLNAVMGRIGLAARGCLYLLLGILAAFGIGKSAPDQQNVIRTVASQPFGTVLLSLLAVGIACYAMWRLGHAILDTEGYGTDLKGLQKRMAAFTSGCIYVTLLITAVSVVFHFAQSKSGEVFWTAKLLDQPFGRGLVAGVGVILAITSLMQFQHALTGKFRRRLNLSGMSETGQTWSIRAGRIGHAARGVAFALIAWFFFRAAMEADPSESGGMRKALTMIADQPYGKWLRMVTGLGLSMFGVYSLVEARYRRIGG